MEGIELTPTQTNEIENKMKEIDKDLKALHAKMDSMWIPTFID